MRILLSLILLFSASPLFGMLRLAQSLGVQTIPRLSQSARVAGVMPLLQSAPRRSFVSEKSKEAFGSELAALQKTFRKQEERREREDCSRRVSSLEEQMKDLQRSELERKNQVAAFEKQIEEGHAELKRRLDLIEFLREQRESEQNLVDLMKHIGPRD